MLTMNLLKQRAKIFYSDGLGIQCRIGVVTEIDEAFFTLENSVLIPREKIVRVELIAPPTKEPPEPPEQRDHLGFQPEAQR